MTNGFSETVLQEMAACDHCGRNLYEDDTVFTRDEKDVTRTVLCGVDCLLKLVDDYVAF